MDFKEGPGIRNWQYVEGDGIPFMNIRLIQDGDIKRSRANKISIEEAFGKYKHFLLEEGDMVISTSGTLGRSAIVRKHHLPLCLNTSVIRFRPLGCGYAFMYSYLQSPTFLNQLNFMASGSVQKNFGPTHLKQIRIQVPSKDKIDRFETTSSSWWHAIQKNREKIDNLTRQRDTLLPKLMSGEVRVQNIRING